MNQGVSTTPKTSPSPKGRKPIASMAIFFVVERQVPHPDIDALK